MVECPGLEVAVLHGMVALAMDHPGVKSIGLPEDAIMFPDRKWTTDRSPG